MPADPLSAPFSPPLPLEAGDRLSRDEFERRYDAMPHVKKAELIEGVVFMPSPVRQRRHGRALFRLVGWLGNYALATPGTEGGDNSTVRLDVINEPQPDALLFVLPECGGQVRLSADDYIEHAPDLVCDVSASSASIDRHTKLEVYRRSGVREYIVWRCAENALDWFVLRDEKFVPLQPENGVLRSEAFPGLWLDVAALLRGDSERVLEVVRQGVASPEHAAFVAQLRCRFNPSSRGTDPGPACP